LYFSCVRWKFVTEVGNQVWVFGQDVENQTEWVPLGAVYPYEWDDIPMREEIMRLRFLLASLGGM
jgi:hypothetical protein